MKSSKVIWCFSLIFFFINGCGIKAAQRKTKVVKLKAVQSNNEQIKFNGVYQYLSPDNYHYPLAYENGIPITFVDTPYLSNPLILFQSGDIFFSKTTFLQKADFDGFVSKEVKYSIYANEGWGTFSVNGSVINAIIYLRFHKRGFVPIQTFLCCYFQGNITGHNSITNWRLIEPYPKTIDYFFNKKTIEYFKLPLNLDFRNMSEISIITPNEAWINKIK